MVAVMEEYEEEPPEKKPRILLCEVCNKEESKYKCPRCFYRTCSVQCSKQHKKEFQCSGERDTKSFSIVRRLADCNAATIADDEKFLSDIEKCVEEVVKRAVALEAGIKQSMERKLNNGTRGDSNTKDVAAPAKNMVESEPCSSVGKAPVDKSNDVQRQCSKMTTAKQRYLLNSALRRRIWLTIPDDGEEDSSRFEHYSDTIFWTIDLIFRRQINAEEPSNVVDYFYSVNSIPERISVSTLVKQFIKPKKIGPVVNRDELDEVKLEPFQQVGLDGLTVYMPVPLENKERYYVVDLKKTILDNLRNRYITAHPTFIITLDTQMGHYITLSEQEAQELAEARKARDAEERRRRSGFRGNKFGFRQGFNKRGGDFGSYQNQNRHHDDGISETSDTLEKRKHESEFSNTGNECFSDGNGRHSQRHGHFGFRKPRSDDFGKRDLKRNWHSFRRYRERERDRMRPSEMSPSQLQAADVSQSFGYRETPISPDDVAMLAWARAVDSHTRQGCGEPTSHEVGPVPTADS